MQSQSRHVSCTKNMALGIGAGKPYSHSMVPGGLDVMSYTTRLTPQHELCARSDLCEYKEVTPSSIRPAFYIIAVVTPYQCDKDTAN